MIKLILIGVANAIKVIIVISEHCFNIHCKRSSFSSFEDKAKITNNIGLAIKINFLDKESFKLLTLNNKYKDIEEIKAYIQRISFGINMATNIPKTKLTKIMIHLFLTLLYLLNLKN